MHGALYEEARADALAAFHELLARLGLLTRLRRPRSTIAPADVRLRITHTRGEAVLTFA